MNLQYARQLGVWAAVKWLVIVLALAMALDHLRNRTARCWSWLSVFFLAESCLQWRLRGRIGIRKSWSQSHCSERCKKAG